MKIRTAVFLLLVAGPLACAHQAERCWVCEREIHSQVRATLTLGDGRQVPACCPRCALHYMEEAGHKVREIHVTDYASGGTLPLERAFLVEGSDETPCIHHPPVMDETRAPMQVCYDRCMPSLIAFQDAAGASAFISGHGGTLHSPPAPPGASAASR